MSENILELRGITKRFSGVEVLHEVSFSLRPGEVHALLGENGAGKSTLVKVMTGVHQPDSGEIHLNGEQVHFASARDSRQAGIAAIYQELSLFPDLNVAENIFAGRQPTRPGGRIDWRRLYLEAGNLLTSLGVRLDLKQKARSLSIAQQQKVIIAPTTVGIAAAARAVQDANMVGKVFVTGLGTPNQMRDYVKSGACPEFALWNPSDLGYLAIYALDAIATGKMKGMPGDTFTAGKLGSYTVLQDGSVLLGPPTIFNKDNIDNFNF